MAGTVAVTASNFEAEVLKSDVPVVVDFWAVWCGPCRMVAPIVEELAKQYEGRVKVASLNVDEERGLAQKYGIQSIPTLVFFKGGSTAGQIIGVQPKEKIAAKLDELLEG
jgi:thioredoxin 1